MILSICFNPAKGEPYRLALAAGEYRVAIVIVPDPILAKDKGCTLSVERLLPHFELAYFTGHGFPVNMEASFDAQSYDEKHPVKTKTDSNGNLRFALMPFVSGHGKGATTVKAVGMDCSPAVKFDWGSKPARRVQSGTLFVTPVFPISPLTQSAPLARLALLYLALRI